MSIQSSVQFTLGSGGFAAALGAVSSSYGTFQGSSLEFSRYCSEQFEAEVNLRGLLRKLVTMMSSWVGVGQTAFILPAVVNDYSDDQFDLVTFHGVSPFSQDVITQLRIITAQEQVAGKLDDGGIVRVSVTDTECYCAKFAAPNGESGILVWTSLDVGRMTPGVLLQPERTSPVELLDFLVDCAQRAARWLQRLDSAQSLLYQDEVTGLFNFRYLHVALDSEFRRLQRFHVPFSLLFIDLDDFKSVNDVYGHLTGSSILRQVGVQIKAALRDVDVVIRYGGDEFVVVLIGTNSKQALLAAERVRAQVDRFNFKVEGSNSIIHVSTSIGVASCPEHAKDKKTVLKLADETMYMAKRSGKNRVVMVQTKNSQVAANLTLPREG